MATPSDGPRVGGRRRADGRERVRGTRALGLGASGQVPLHPDSISFRHPRRESGVDVARVGHPKVMDVVPRGDGFHSHEARVLVNRCEHEMTTKPRLLNHDRHERHPGVKCDSRLLRQDGDGTAGLDHGADSPEERLDRARFPVEVPRERLARAAEVRLTTIRESPPASGAAPERTQPPNPAAPHYRTRHPRPGGWRKARPGTTSPARRLAASRCRRRWPGRADRQIEKCPDGAKRRGRSRRASPLHAGVRRLVAMPTMASQGKML